MSDFYQKLKNQFKLRAESFDNSACWVRNKKLIDIHQKLAQVSNNSLVLDVCCGTGIVGENLLCNGSKAIGLDISLSMLKKAKERLSLCINGEAEHLPFLNNVFDVVICRQAFHFLDITKVMKELFRVTKSGGGKIIISQIVPFSEEDSPWLHKIHRKKQLLLKNFLKEKDFKLFLKNLGCVDITTLQCCIEEPINSWLKDTFFSKKEIEDIKNMFLHAPLKYKILHCTREKSGKVFDTMRWVVTKGIKM